ncbi:MAG TPA: glycosyltransferase, partial [Candidatus Binatia bacterium]
MKILIFVQDVGLGGVLRQTSLLADGLGRKGHEVSVLGLAERDRNWRYVWNSGVELSVLYTKPSSGAPGRAARLIRTALALRSRVKKEKVDVLYALQGDVVKFISWLATRGTEVRLVWGRRGSGNRTGPYYSHWKRSVVFRLCDWASGSVPLAIANSEAGARQER